MGLLAILAKGIGALGAHLGEFCLSNGEDIARIKIIIGTNIHYGLKID
jgi:hypothetical protein